MSEAPGIELLKLTVDYGRTRALSAVSTTLPGGSITGLLGRNAAGKSTMLATIAGFRLPSAGQVLIDGEEPFENERLTSNICLVRDGSDILPSYSVRHNLQIAADLRPNWDAGLAERLLTGFRLPPRKRVEALSRGQRAAVGAIIGLASRAPVTIFDEIYLGMDAPARQLFFDTLLAEQIREPRTVIITSHFLEEAERLLESAMIIDQGKLLFHDALDDLSRHGGRVVGPVAAARDFARNYRVLGEQLLGGVAAVSIQGPLAKDAAELAASAGLELEPLSLQDYYIGLTGDVEQGKEAGGTA